MKTKHLYYLAVLTILITACKNSNDDPKNSVKKDVFGGYAQKGPFVNGSSVTISELDAKLDQTGKTYQTTISDNSGSFEKKNIELVSNYVELKVDGFYFNEISGKTSTSPMTLYALADVKEVNSVNVNVLTHLEKPRVEYLVKQEGKSFSEAKKQAQREVLAIFGFEAPAVSSEALNLTDNATLLAISCILQSNLSTGDMMELIANIGADIKTDGTLDDMALGTKLMNSAYTVSLSAGHIRNNLTTKYAELGGTVTIPDFESCVKSLVDSKLYPLTFVITYPATGLYGDNILSDAVTSVKRGLNYSMRAEIPPYKLGDNFSMLSPIVRIVCVEETDIDYAYSVNQWSLPQNGYDKDQYIYEFSPGAMESDMQIQIFGKDYITIEYVESYMSVYVPMTTWTRVKKLYIED
jgi:hypothetical protein